ncbi:MAG: ornithine carbamoyltransferase [Fervidicoccus fontis]|nr:MAG: ornithine carbamoyltransferase [Fervidicoccus fontis]
MKLDPRKLKGRDFLSILDLSEEEMKYVITFARDLKKFYYSGKRTIKLLNEKILFLIFQKPSTRTRLSFEIAMKQLGGHAIYSGWTELQLSRGEDIADTARVLSRYGDGIVARVYEQQMLEELAKHSEIPVINGLSDIEHPVQALSDLMTIEEYFGSIQNLTVAFIGDGKDNVLNSLMIASLMLGSNFRVATPRELYPIEKYTKIASQIAENKDLEFIITEDPKEAIEGADVVYTDTWVSMGKEKEAERRKEILLPYRVDKELFLLASERAVFMHCLPAHKGEEVTTEVFESNRSIVWQQAENRLHLQKGLLALLL